MNRRSASGPWRAAAHARASTKPAGRLQSTACAGNDHAAAKSATATETPAALWTDFFMMGSLMMDTCAVTLETMIAGFGFTARCAWTHQDLSDDSGASATM